MMVCPICSHLFLSHAQFYYHLRRRSQVITLYHVRAQEDMEELRNGGHRCSEGVVGINVIDGWRSCETQKLHELVVRWWRSNIA